MKGYRHHAYSAVFAALMLLGAPGAAMADCTSPAGKAGSITWNGTDSVIWCDGTNWYALKNAAGSSGSAGYIQFSNGSGGFSNSGTTAGEQLFWDDTNKRLGIGTTTPANKLDVNGALITRGSPGVPAISMLGDIDEAKWAMHLGSYRLSFMNDNTDTTAIPGTSSVAAYSRTFWDKIAFTPAGHLLVAGSVGIGTSSPTRALHVEDNAANTSASDWRIGGYIIQKINPLATSSSTFSALEGVAMVNGSSDITTAYGGRGGLQTNGTNNITNALGWTGLTYVPTASTVTNAYGTKGEVRTNHASASVTNAYAGSFAVTKTLGTITNGMGVYIGTIQATNKWGLYSVDSTANNYFAGNVGIGTTTPGSALQVYGNAAVSDTSGTITNGGYLLRLYSTTNMNGLNLYYQNADVNGAALTLQKYKSGGNEIAAGDILGSIDFFGTTGAGNALRAAQIRATAETGWGGTGDAPGRLTFWTTPDGTSTAVERMRIDNAGNVGIGITTPGSALHVSGTDNTAYATSSSAADGPAFLSSPTAPMAMIANIGNTDGQGAYLSFLTRNSAANGQRAYIGAISNTAGRAPTIVFGQQTALTAYAERMRIDGTGNVGIGTTAPALPLHVVGGQRISAGGLQLYNEDNWNSVIAYNFSTSKYSALRGIRGRGTAASPASVQAGDFLTIFDAYGYDSASTTAYAGGMSVNAETTFSSAVNSYLMFSTTSAGTNAERVRITSAGNVGIGTVAPANKLSVVAGSDTWATTFYGLSSSNTVRIGTLSGVATIGANNNAGNAWAALGINPGGDIYLAQNSGNVGIGTASPAAKLDVNGFMRLAKNGSAPATCDATIDGAIALTSARRMCVCDATSWKEVNSATACTW